MRVLISFLAVVAGGCTELNPDCDPAMLACYAKHPDAWEKECLSKVDLRQQPDMSIVPRGVGSACQSNADCMPTWTWTKGDMSWTFDLTCYDLGAPLGKRCCAEAAHNCAP